jgi:hypothetical protein
MTAPAPTSYVEEDPADTAAHEAAHVVVGVALGLRLMRAAVCPPGRTWLGYTWFPSAKGIPYAITLAAGIAWERQHANRPSPGDEQLLRELGHGPAVIRALAVAAGAIVETRQRAHERVTHALLEHDLTHVDVVALARGERL